MSEDPHLAVSPFQVEGRKAQDVIWGALYLCFFLASFIICMVQVAPATAVLENEVNCVQAMHDMVDNNPSVRINVNTDGADEFIYDLLNMLHFLHIPSWGGLLIGAGWMGALYAYPRPIVYFTLLFKVIVLFALGILMAILTDSAAWALSLIHI